MMNAKSQPLSFARSSLMRLQLVSCVAMPILLNFSASAEIVGVKLVNSCVVVIGMLLVALIVECRKVPQTVYSMICIVGQFGASIAMAPYE